MNSTTIFVFLTILLFSCNDNRKNNFTQTTSNKVNADTIVGSKTITDEIAGEAYRTKGYFVIIGKDTSEYTCVFRESKESGKVSIDFNNLYAKTKTTYRQRIEELKIMMPEAAKDFNLDSIKDIYVGRLVENGDLAVEITKQYTHKYGTKDKLQSYLLVGQFLKESKLGTDLNALLNPYSITVDKVSPEKLFFTTQSDLFWESKLETDTTLIPDKILDCMAWITLTKKLNNYP